MCAGFQVIGGTFPDSAGRPQQGVGLLDLTTARAPAPGPWGSWWPPRRPRRRARRPGERLPRLTGFENHGGVSVVGPGRAPLARVEHGIGNGGGDGTEGAWSGRVLGTYLHGPVLARNTALADLLLGWALAPAGCADGPGVALEPLDDYEELALRAERLEAVDGGPVRWRDLVRRVVRGG